jgi:hypothetical protein
MRSGCADFKLLTQILKSRSASIFTIRSVGLTCGAVAQISEGLSEDYTHMLADWHRVCAGIRTKLEALPARLKPQLVDGSMNSREDMLPDAHAAQKARGGRRRGGGGGDDTQSSQSPDASGGVGLAMHTDHVPQVQAGLHGQDVEMVLAAHKVQDTKMCISRARARALSFLSLFLSLDLSRALSLSLSLSHTHTHTHTHTGCMLCSA